jgi:hypothetical protein
MAPEEPGFRLEKVPVHSMKEAWGILEVGSRRYIQSIGILTDIGRTRAMLVE